MGCCVCSVGSSGGGIGAGSGAALTAGGVVLQRKRLRGGCGVAGPADMASESSNPKGQGTRHTKENGAARPLAAK